MESNVALWHLLMPCRVDFPEITDAGNKGSWYVRNASEVTNINNVDDQKQRNPNIELGEDRNQDLFPVEVGRDGILQGGEGRRR